MAKEETTPVRIPKSLMRLLKIQAAKEDTSASEIATAGAEKELAGRIAKAEQERKGDN